MKKFISALLIVIFLFTVTIPKQEAKADALVISQLAAAAYAMASGSGLDFTFTAGTGAGAQTFMENRLTSWVGNQSGGINIFGTTPVKAIAAKLAITQTAFEALKNFINDMITDLGIGMTSTQLSPGTVGGVEYDTYSTQIGQKAGFWFNSEWTSISKESTHDNSYKRGTYAISYGIDGNTIGTTSIQFNNVWYFYKITGWKIANVNDNPTSWRITYLVKKINSDNGAQAYDETQSVNFTYSGIAKQNQISALVPDGMTYPDLGLNDLQTYKRQDWGADTNLDQMLGDIFDDVADNNLDLTDETIEDIPDTPVPTDPPALDIPGQLGGIQEGLNDLIGTQTGIAEGVSDIAGSLEGVQEGVDAISEALEGVGTGVGSIAEALEIPTTSEATQLKLPDLRTLFPFCIPFDIYNIITAFNASPVAPHVQIPFNVPAIGLAYTFDLDFSSYNSVAAVLRTVEFVAYAIGLAILSSKVIRW